jgi:hypothetical protein
MKTAIASGIFLLFVACACFTDDGSYVIKGTCGTVMPVKNNSITMTKETIRFDLETHGGKTYFKEPAVDDFKFFIDGKEATYRIFPAERNPQLENVPAYDIVCASEIAFAPAELKAIRNTIDMIKQYDTFPSDPIGHGMKLQARESREWELGRGDVPLPTLRVSKVDSRSPRP